MMCLLNTNKMEKKTPIWGNKTFGTRLSSSEFNENTNKANSKEAFFRSNKINASGVWVCVCVCAKLERTQKGGQIVYIRTHKEETILSTTKTQHNDAGPQTD